jgi:hypothetical protein
MKSGLIAVALLLVLPGCYHATIETGLPPGTQVIDQPFASSWIYGLVPPKTVEAAAKCPHGVAKVETQMSFVNGLVGCITFGIYTPMTIHVTCASGGGAELSPAASDIVVAANASSQDIQKAFMKAAEMAVKEGRPVYVEY